MTEDTIQKRLDWEKTVRIEFVKYQKIKDKLKPTKPRDHKFNTPTYKLAKIKKNWY